MITSQVRRRTTSRPGGHNFSPRRLSDVANQNDRLISLRKPPVQVRRIPKLNRVLKLSPYLKPCLDLLDNPELLQKNVPEHWENLGAWTLYAECGTRHPLYTGPYGKDGSSFQSNASSIRDLTKSGLTGQGTSYVGNPWAGVATYVCSVAIGKTTQIGGSYRMQLQEAYTRPSSGAFEKPYLVEASNFSLPQIAPNPKLWPLTADPGLSPPNSAPPFAPPVPYRLSPRWSHPNRVARYDLHNRPQERPFLEMPWIVPNDWSIAVEARSRPFTRKDLSKESKRNPARGLGKAPRNHSMTKPRPRDRVKESKVKMPAILVSALKLYGQATEVGDFVDCLYDALPKAFRPRYKDTRYEKRKVSFYEKVEALILHGDKINIPLALFNLGANQIEDKYYGTVGRLGSDVSIRQGLNYGAGLNSLGSRLRKYNYDATRAVEKELDGEQQPADY